MCLLKKTPITAGRIQIFSTFHEAKISKFCGDRIKLISFDRNFTD